MTRQALRHLPIFFDFAREVSPLSPLIIRIMPNLPVSCVLFSLFCERLLVAQAGSNPGTAQNTVVRAANLAESGRCAEALPLLKKSIRQVTDKELQKRVSLDGLHCAMTHNAPYDSLVFLEVLSREFPNDPE